MDLRYHEHTAESAPAFAVLIWSFVAVCTTYIFGTLLTASGQLRTLNWMAAGGMVLNIGLNLWTIPRWQALGAAWAGLITQGLTALVQIAIASRRYRMRVRWTQVVALAVYAGLLMLLTRALLAQGFSFLQAVPVLAAGVVLAAFATGMLSVKVLRAAMAMGGNG
jgi:O-antigen/teichoic acid export membrane protein